MRFDLELLKLLWMIGSGVAGLIGGVAVLWLKSGFVPRGDFEGATDRLDKTLTRHDTRLTVVEQALIHSPKKEDITDLRDDISKIARELAELRGEQKAQNNLLGSIHDHLLNKP